MESEVIYKFKTDFHESTSTRTSENSSDINISMSRNKNKPSYCLVMCSLVTRDIGISADRYAYVVRVTSENSARRISEFVFFYVSAYACGCFQLCPCLWLWLCLCSCKNQPLRTFARKFSSRQIILKLLLQSDN